MICYKEVAVLAKQQKMEEEGEIILGYLIKEIYIYLLRLKQKIKKNHQFITYMLVLLYMIQ